jgi:uncharacterized membrane protein
MFPLRSILLNSSLEVVMWWWDGNWTGQWTFGPFPMIGMTLICVAFMYFMMRGMRGVHGRPNDALDILNARLARGDITREQYEEQKQLIVP